MSGFNNLSGLSDAQFRASVAQIHATPIPSVAARATRSRASASSTPQPTLRLAPPGFTPQYTAPVNQPPVPQIPIPIPPTNTDPNLPPTSLQAYYSSYASRLRTGATLLVQPTIFPGSNPHNTNNSNVSYPAASTSTSVAYSSPFVNSIRPTRSSRRPRGAINYAELDDDDDMDGSKNDADDDPDHVPDAGALDDDATDTDFNVGRRPGRPRNQPQPHVQASGPELDQTYLGQVPPAHFIKPRPYQSLAATTAGPMLGFDYGSNYPSSSSFSPPPLLVPVRVEFDVPDSGLRIRDVFVWNLHENLRKSESFYSVHVQDSSQITPQMFAAQFCKDLEIPAEPYAEMVANQIRAQVEDARGEAWVAWMDAWGSEPLNNMRDEYEEDMEHLVSIENSPAQSSISVSRVNPECRVILAIDVQIATYHLTDHIEWDLLSPLTPEAFANQLCKDLGLAGEAIPLIAHAVHEELCRHRKDAVEWGIISAVTTGSSIGEENAVGKDKTGLGFGNLGRPSRERDGRYPKPLQSVWRDWAEAEEYATRWEELSPEEVERREIERERAGRRLRRETSKWRRR
ncbi:hypothetical protein BDP27DRAFT_1390221 [Rhodocollybia butyracea]|uniref:SNF5-domain-containing protein n=1 Tax=Rhodocollybia butyracea TaxID=206335 RepID=A0A9P5UDN2_9AGAR|nr:hypothetical protein BDP27DRAFT_1390221 [Rhodocollybia butyracea]